jgi:hypothetical protein
MQRLFVALRFAVSFASLKALRSEWPFELADWLSAKPIQYIGNALYILVITHAFQHALAYQYDLSLLASDPSHLLPYSTTIAVFLLKLIATGLYLTEKLSV